MGQAEIEAETERLRASLAAQGITMPGGAPQASMPQPQQISSSAATPPMMPPPSMANPVPFGVPDPGLMHASEPGTVDMRGMPMGSMSADQVEHMNQQAQNDRTGLNVAGITSYQRREAEAKALAEGKSIEPRKPSPDVNGLDTGAGPSMLTQQAGGPRAQFVPASWQDSRVPYHKLTRQHLMGAMDAEQAADERGAQIEAQAAADKAVFMVAQDERADLAQALRAKREDARQVHVNGQLAKLQEATDSASRLEVNPDHYFQEKGTFGRIASAIGVAIGGGIAAANGGRNIVADQVDNAIQRDIDVQKSNIELKKQNVHAQSNMLVSYREAFGDERLAELALETSAREIAIQKAKTLAQQSQSPIIQANADAVVAQLQQRQEQKRMEFEKMAHVQAHIVGGAGAATPKNNALYVPALGGNARTEAEATKLRERSGAILQIQENLRKAAKLREEMGKSGIALDMIWKDPRAEELASIVEETKPMFSVAFGQGAAGEAESGRYATAMGGLLNFRGEPHKAALKAAQRLGENIESLSKTSGIVGAEEGFRTNPHTGQLENVQALTGDRAARPNMAWHRPRGFVPNLPEK